MVKVSFLFSFLLINFFLFNACSSFSSGKNSNLEQKFLLNTDGKKIETYTAFPSAPPPWPVLVVLHGHQENPSLGVKDLVAQQAAQWNPQGVMVIGMSQPGYGESEGPGDFAGLRSQDALEQVLDGLRAMKNVHAKKIVLYGINRGAALGATVLARDSDLRAAVLVSGFYDLESILPKWNLSKQGDTILGNWMEETRGTPKEISLPRSALKQNPIRVPFLAIHGELDPLCDVGQARALVERSRRLGVPAELIVRAEFAHHIPAWMRDSLAKDFLTKYLLDK